MRVGIIGGSGLYHLEELEGTEEIHLETPFGKPSSSFVTGEIHGVPVAFLPRHGIGHVLMPTEIPFRANIWGLKKLGVTHLISVGAVGSLKEKIAPGHMVFPDQFIDLTRHRSSTFFGNGLVGHVQFGDPVCAMLSSRLVEAAKKVGRHQRLRRQLRRASAICAHHITNILKIRHSSRLGTAHLGGHPSVSKCKGRHSS